MATVDKTTVTKGVLLYRMIGHRGFAQAYSRETAERDVTGTVAGV